MYCSILLRANYNQRFNLFFGVTRRQYQYSFLFYSREFYPIARLIKNVIAFFFILAFRFQQVRLARPRFFLVLLAPSPFMFVLSLLHLLVNVTRFCICFCFLSVLCIDFSAGRLAAFRRNFQRLISGFQRIFNHAEQVMTVLIMPFHCGCAYASRLASLMDSLKSSKITSLLVKIITYAFIVLTSFHQYVIMLLWAFGVCRVRLFLFVLQHTIHEL